MAKVFPIFKPFEVGAGLAEKLKFHLLEFSYSEDKVAGRYLVTEALSHLTYAERHFSSRCPQYVFEVYENALSRFGAEIYDRGAVFGNALESLEHKVKFSYRGKVALSADRAGDFVFGNIAFHLLVCPRSDVFFDALLFHIFFNQGIRSVTGFTAFAVKKRVGKTAYVSRRFPNGRIHKYRTVKSDVIFRLDDEFFPPSRFYVVF